jgi:cytochrome o ubiquinol oxidase subunit 3
MSHSGTLTQNEPYEKIYFGFWLYLLTDVMMFGSLFATYLVLKGGTAGGPSAQDLFHLPRALLETLLLLTSSLFAGLARVQALRHQRKGAMIWYAIVFLLGALFLSMTYAESKELLLQGYSWQRSAFLSSFFTLIWTHAFHLVAGLIWILVVLIQLAKRGITQITFRRLSCLTLFWQFLAVIWVFTFTIVYLMGAAGL